jgi:hypothetical protein
LNILKLSHLALVRTHEGAPARVITSEQALRRSVLACMLWEDEFYEEGVLIAGRIRELVPKVEASLVARLAIEAREAMKLRHVPLLLVREMARHASHRSLVAQTLARVIQRADELAEFMAIYWADALRLHRRQRSEDRMLIDARILHVAKVAQQSKRTELSLRKQSLPVRALLSTGRQRHLPRVGSCQLSIDQSFPKRCLLCIVRLRMAEKEHVAQTDDAGTVVFSKCVLIKLSERCC